MPVAPSVMVTDADSEVGGVQLPKLPKLSVVVVNTESNALLVLTVAAAAAAIGLAILVVYFRNRGSIAVDDINLMKG